MPKSDKPEREEEEQEQPLFTDKRRVDPETGDVRPEAAEAASGDDITEEDIELLAEASVTWWRNTVIVLRALRPSSKTSACVWSGTVRQIGKPLLLK